MDNRTQRINKLMQAEVASKSAAPAVVFGSMAILVFFYKFTLTTFAFELRAASVCVVIASVIRLLFGKRLLKHPSRENWSWVQISIWLNTVSWAVIFSFTTLELRASGPHYVVAMVMVTSYVAASLVTLAYDKWLFIPFQVLNLGTLVIVTAYLSYTFHDSAHTMLAGTFFCFLLYQFRQYGEYRKHLEQRFNYQLDLEDSFDALKQSKETLVEQTLKLIQSSKAQALGEMAGGLSHEVNNALQVILGSIQQMERQMRAENVQLSDYSPKISKINGAIQKIKMVIDGLRHFSLQMESSTKEPIELADIIKRTLNFCHEMINAYSIDLQIGEIPDVKVECHPIQVTQVLFTLLKNAFDATDNLQEDRWIRLSFQVEKKWVFLRIENGGPKIRPEIAARIFQPFFTTKEIGKGMGLSLSIAKGIATEHAGELFLDEAAAHPSFVLQLPRS